jgi:hypothetical protein
MVDSRNFKNFNNKNSRGVSNNLKKKKWIPFVVIVALAIALIALNYFMMDILQWANESMQTTPTGTEESSTELVNFARVMIGL